MSKIDNFKKFVSLHPEFINYMGKHKNVSWQSLYELYDIYGENNDIWQKYLKEDESLLNIKGLFNTIKNINLDSLEENIGSIQKAVGLVEELTRKDKEEKENIIKKETNIDKIYGEE